MQPRVQSKVLWESKAIKNLIKHLCFLIVVVSLCPQQSSAWFIFTGGPVSDRTDTALSRVNAAENRLANLENVKKTVEMLEQLASLVQLYDNAVATYESVGRARDAVRNSKGAFKRTINSWRFDDITLHNLGSKLQRWGIRPAEEGPLARFNESVFGHGSPGADYLQMTQDIRQIARTVPYRFARDSFIRRVVTESGEKPFRERNNLPSSIVKQTSEGTVEMPINADQRARLQVAAADVSFAEHLVQNQLIVEDGRIFDQVIEQAIGLYENEEDVTMSRLYVDQNRLKAIHLQARHNKMEMKMRNAEMDMAGDSAFITMLEYDLEKESRTGVVNSAMER